MRRSLAKRQTQKRGDLLPSTSAAGLVAVAGAQAADLPVKAKPVEYVKICSLYGVGFYYIPGTDMCLKIGGWVRAEYGYGDNANMTVGPFPALNLNDRFTNNSTWRARGYLTADARNQTEYGTVRGYLAVGLSTNTELTPRAIPSARTVPSFSGPASRSVWRSRSMTSTASRRRHIGASSRRLTLVMVVGWLGYTAQFGNGFSATLAAEMHRNASIFNADSVAFLGVGGTPVIPPTAGALLFPTGSSYGGFQAPDIVGNLRVDQAWGSAQIMGAWHQVNATYYTLSLALGLLPALNGDAAGHPGDKSGWVLGAGLKLNTPWLLNWLGTGAGDYFQFQVNYTQGALRYIFMNPNGSFGFRDGAGFGFGIDTDAVYGGTIDTATTTDLQLTTAWNVNAAYEHFWNPRWRTSLYGGYAEVSFNGRANAMLCSQGFQQLPLVGGVGVNAVARAGCDNDWNTWWLGSRTQWNVTKDFYMGVDVLYQKLNSATTPTGLVPTGLAVLPFGVSHVENVDNWAFRFRVHRDFYP